MLETHPLEGAKKKMGLLPIKVLLFLVSNKNKQNPGKVFRLGNHQTAVTTASNTAILK